MFEGLDVKLNPLEQLEKAVVSALNNWAVALLVALVLVLVFGLPGWIAVGRQNAEGAAPEPELIHGPNASQSTRVVQLDGANMGAGTNADAQRLANVPPAHAPGNFVSELARGSEAAHLRWCGVDNINAYKAKGYAMGKNPQGWILNTDYDGEPSLRSVGTGKEGARVIPDDLSNLAGRGL